ncbi:hypothetical protein MMC34_006755 [Xylographa carneopallida]|nr:hypothetical protein [Xylographa carneopallida]
MSYPPPPGLKAPHVPPSATTPQPHSSLPPRPPPPAGPQPSFKSALASSPLFLSGAPGTRGYSGFDTNGQAAGSYGGFTGFQPRSVAANSLAFRNHAATVSVPPAPSAGFSAATTYSNGSFPQPLSYQQPSAPSYQQPPTPAYYQQSGSDEPFQPTPPQIRNPFPLPGQEPSSGLARGRNAAIGQPGTDPELEAQIAQWQSAYASKDESTGKGLGRISSRFGGGGEGAGSATGANSGPLGGRSDLTAPSMSSADITSAVNADTGVAAIVTGADGKQKTVVRSGGGQTWQDSSLLEWDPAHFRIFVGNLAGEVTDESLLKAFVKYGSVQKARVVRDKRTTKSRGFGFVSFSQGDDYFNAAREMQGKYIGSHPVLIKKSTTEIRPTVPKDKKKGGKSGKGGNYGNGDKTGSGVQKKQSKTKGGLKVLG